MKAEFILFDCMETLIDLHKLPALEDYAGWAYKGSGLEGLWEDFDEFVRAYRLAKDTLSGSLPEYKEYEMMDRFSLLTSSSLKDAGPGFQKDAAGRLYDTYWKAYRSECYVRDDVRSGLDSLSKAVRLGIVSNFMVRGGIEQLARDCGIYGYFNFILTSVSMGWRKPHPAIYRDAIARTGVKADEILFVGDDYVNDYKAPRELGMNPVLLDRYGRHPEAEQRIESFEELADYLSL